MPGLCATCKYFIHRKRGSHGGLRGSCKLSRSDREKWENGGQTRPVTSLPKCARYVREDVC